VDNPALATSGLGDDIVAVAIVSLGRGDSLARCARAQFLFRGFRWQLWHV